MDPAARSVSMTSAGLAADPMRVLIVDDNVDQASTLTAFLASCGREVRYVTRALSALELAKAWVPDVVLLDIGMPVMDGYQALRHFRDMLPRVRIYALTEMALRRTSGVRELRAPTATSQKAMTRAS